MSDRMDLRVVARLDLDCLIPAKEVLPDDEVELADIEKTDEWWDSHIRPTPEDPAFQIADVGDECSGFWRIKWRGVEYVVQSIDLDYNIFPGGPGWS